METSLLEGTFWAAAEFGGASLGDARRNRRLVKLAAGLADSPDAVLYRSMENAADLKGAYRLLENESVTADEIRKSHLMRTHARCARPGHYLLIEDTTTLNYSGLLATEGLGRIGDDTNRGLFLHSTLAAEILNWNDQNEPALAAIGLFAQKSWARTMPTVGSGKEKSRDRLKRKRESQRWGAAQIEYGGPPPGVSWTLVTDREGDIYELFEKCAATGTDFIIRACEPRALLNESGSVFDAVQRAPVLCRYTLNLRARPGQKKRTAELEVRVASVELRAPKRPGGRPEPLRVNVVEAREINAPSGSEPIHWILLTTWDVSDAKAALRVIKAYTRRWLIEEYHKVLKTGLSVEETQLMMARSIEALLAILGVVGMKLLDLKLLASAQPDGAIAEDDFSPEALMILEKKYERPATGWTYLTILVAIARLGGFLARTNDGPPGWIVIWRGWHRLTFMIEGVQLAKGMT